MAQDTFGQALRAAMLRRGTTQEAIAEAAGVSRATVSEWMRDRAEPRPVHVFAVERSLELAPGALSWRLGFVPVEAARPPSADPVDAIRGFSDLSPESRDALSDVYRALARADTERSAIRARSRRPAGRAAQHGRSG